MKRVVLGWVLPLCVACAHQAPPLTLRRVVLHQSGSGFFERVGRVGPSGLTLRLPPHEVDDALATLTVLDEDDARREPLVVSAGVPHPPREGAPREDSVGLDLRLPGARARTLRVSYAVPTAEWRVTYRVILGERPGSPARLQVWALVHNASHEDWRDVEMTLATGAPLSFSSSLRAPTFASRPDITAQLGGPVALGAVRAERSVAEPDGDSDHDRVADVDDRCPDDPETYNGVDDVDGCPDRGLVTLENANLRILHAVRFEANASAVGAAQSAVLDAVAATLRANPQIARVELRGHADPGERDAWSLGTERAAAVRAALIARGVDGARLAVRSLADGQPLAPGASPEARASNRRVEFSVMAREESGAAREQSPPRPVRRAPAPPPLARAEAFMGATRYVIGAPVTLPAGTASLVTVASVETAGDDVYLYRPEANAPGSGEHPYRAVHLRNGTGLTLIPGQTAVFARGTFVGEGILERLDDGERAWIPYALDASTDVTVARESAREPSRVLRIERDAVTLEDLDVARDRYAVRAGAQAPATLFVRSERRPGYRARGLPEGSVSSVGADLVPLALHPGGDHALTVEQVAPVPRTLSLTDDLTTDLAPYLGALDGAVRAALDAVRTQRAELARVEREVDDRREQITDAAARSAELRETLASLRATTPAQAALRAQVTRRLQESVARHDALSQELAARTATAATLRAELAEAARTLRYEAPSQETHSTPPASPAAH